jgi:hypothetical protein
MAVLRIVSDKWEGVMNHEEEIERPTPADFGHLLDRLDARTYTMIVLDAGGEHHLTIGGGAGQYVVYATFDNEEFWNLLRPELVAGTIMLNAGGQEGDYPAAQVVDKAYAAQAGRTFLMTGRLDSSMRWERA